MKTIITTLCTAALLCSCSDLKDEFGCQANISMELVKCTPESPETYTAEYVVTVSEVQLGDSQFKRAFCAQQPFDSQEHGQAVAELNVSGGLPNGTYTVNFNGLRYNTTYEFKPFIATEDYTFQGPSAPPLLRNSVYAVLITLDKPITTAYNAIQVTAHLADGNQTQAPFNGMNIEISTDPSFSNSTITTKHISWNEKQQAYTATFDDLKAGSTYYCHAYTLVNNAKSGSEAQSFQTGVYEDAQAVDLGISVKWADRNVGSTETDICGGHYRWLVNGKVASAPYEICGTELDRATWTWGTGWRMPSYKEFRELLLNCSWTRSTRSGVSGWLVTGVNGNSIFLPSAGFMDSYYNTEPVGVGYSAYYWSGIKNGQPEHLVGKWNDEKPELVNYYIIEDQKYSVRPVRNY